MVQMGLSMAKGSRVPDEMLGEILWMYMMNDDKTIRAAAKSTFMKIAPEDVKQAVKKNWKASYRTLLNVETISEAIHQLVQAFKSQDELNDIIWRLTEPIFKRVKIKPRTRKRAKALMRGAKNIEDKERKNITRFLESDDHGMIRMGASMLKGILEE